MRARLILSGVAVVALGCDDVVQPKKDSVSPSTVVEALGEAYGARNLQKLQAFLATDYAFVADSASVATLGNWDLASWDATREITIHRRMFAPAERPASGGYRPTFRCSPSRSR